MVLGNLHTVTTCGISNSKTPYRNISSARSTLKIYYLGRRLGTLLDTKGEKS